MHVSQLSLAYLNHGLSFGFLRLWSFYFFSNNFFFFRFMGQCSHGNMFYSLIAVLWFCCFQVEQHWPESKKKFGDGGVSLDILILVASFPLPTLEPMVIFDELLFIISSLLRWRAWNQRNFRITSKNWKRKGVIYLLLLNLSGLVMLLHE